MKIRMKPKGTSVTKTSLNQKETKNFSLEKWRKLY